MKSTTNTPVIVTGEERRHPAIRTLARACIALARLRLEKDAAEQSASKKEDDAAEKPANERKNKNIGAAGPEAEGSSNA